MPLWKKTVAHGNQPQLVKNWKWICRIFSTVDLAKLKSYRLQIFSWLITDISHDVQHLPPRGSLLPWSILFRQAAVKKTTRNTDTIIIFYFIYYMFMETYPLETVTNIFPSGVRILLFLLIEILPAFRAERNFILEITCLENNFGYWPSSSLSSHLIFWTFVWITLSRLVVLSPRLIIDCRSADSDHGCQ